VYTKKTIAMDILNFISWIKAGNYRKVLPAETTNLLAVGAKDPTRDDGYLSIAVDAAPLQTLYQTANVTQTGTISTAVTVNALNGIITTVSSTLVADNVTGFTVNNPNVVAGSKILVSVQYDDAISPGSSGIPVASVNNIVNGSFRLVLSNSSSVDNLNNVVKIHYLIIA
jgi:hypothetical protein